MKICAKCKTEKTLSEFSLDRSKKDGKHSYCKLCAASIARKHYDENRASVTERQRKYLRLKRAKIQSVVDSIKSSRGCFVCLERDC